MHPRILGVAGIGLALAACGGAPGALTPQQVVLTAAHNSSSTSLRMDMSGSETFSASGPAAAELNQFSGQAVTLQGHFDVVSAQRVSGSFSATVAGHVEAVDVVVNEGTAYVSTDGGASYRTESVSSLASDEDGVDSALQYLQSLGTVTDAGPGAAYGVSGEKYHATFDPQKVLHTLESALSSVNSQAASLLADALTFRDGAIDVLVDRSDRLVTESGYMDATMDLGALSSALAGSSVSMHVTIDAHFYDYGASITVTPPPTAT